MYLKTLALTSPRPRPRTKSLSMDRGPSFIEDSLRALQAQQSELELMLQTLSTQRQSRSRERDTKPIHRSRSVGSRVQELQSQLQETPGGADSKRPIDLVKSGSLLHVLQFLNTTPDDIEALASKDSGSFFDRVRYNQQVKAEFLKMNFTGRRPNAIDSVRALIEVVKALKPVLNHDEGLFAEQDVPLVFDIVYEYLLANKTDAIGREAKSLNEIIAQRVGKGISSPHTSPFSPRRKLPLVSPRPPVKRTESLTRAHKGPPPSPSRTSPHSASPSAPGIFDFEVPPLAVTSPMEKARTDFSDCSNIQSVLTMLASFSKTDLEEAMGSSSSPVYVAISSHAQILTAYNTVASAPNTMVPNPELGVYVQCVFELALACKESPLLLKKDDLVLRQLLAVMTADRSVLSEVKFPRVSVNDWIVYMEAPELVFQVDKQDDLTSVLRKLCDLGADELTRLNAVPVIVWSYFTANDALDKFIGGPRSRVYPKIGKPTSGLCMKALLNIAYALNESYEVSVKDRVLALADAQTSDLLAKVITGSIISAINSTLAYRVTDTISRHVKTHYSDHSS